MTHFIKILASALFVLFFFARCSSASFQNGVFQDHEATFQVASLSEDWRFIGVHKGKKENDLAWIHKPSATVIQANATCVNVSETPLSALARQLWIGFRNVQVVFQEELDVDFADGYKAEVDATYEGAPLHFVFYLFRKSGCLYDLSLLGKKENISAQIKQQYEQFALSFRPK